MTYGSNEDGEGIITLTPDEKLRFDDGEMVTRINGDHRGEFKIHVQLTRTASARVYAMIERITPIIANNQSLQGRLNNMIISACGDSKKWSIVNETGPEEQIRALVKTVGLDTTEKLIDQLLTPEKA